MLLLPAGSKGAIAKDAFPGAYPGAARAEGATQGGGGGVGGGSSSVQGAAALAPSSAPSASAIAVGKGSGGAADFKLTARPDAGAGEELTFGGPRTSPSWGQRPVPDFTGSPLRLPPPSLKSGNAIAAAGVSVTGESGSAASSAARVEAAGCAKDLDGNVGANGSGGVVVGGGGGGGGGGGVCGGRCEGGGGGGRGEPCATTVLEVSRRRRPRPGSPGKGKVTAVSFTSSRLMTASEEDTFPAPHPALAHASVRRCLVLTPADNDGSSGETMVNGGGAAAVVGGTRSDFVGDVLSAEIRDAVSDVVVADRQVVDLKREVGPGVGARGAPRPGGALLSGNEAELGCGDEGQVGCGDEKGGERGGEEETPGVVLGLGENEGPPPVKQAQDIRWLVAQAKEEVRAPGLIHRTYFVQSMALPADGGRRLRRTGRDV